MTFHCKVHVFEPSNVKKIKNFPLLRDGKIARMGFKMENEKLRKNCDFRCRVIHFHFSISSFNPYNNQFPLADNLEIGDLLIKTCIRCNREQNVALLGCTPVIDQSD